MSIQIIKFGIKGEECRLGQLQLSKIIGKTRVDAMFTLRIVENKLTLPTRLARAEHNESIKVQRMSQSMKRIAYEGAKRNV